MTLPSKNSKNEDDSAVRPVAAMSEVLSDYELIENSIKKPRTKGVKREPP